MASQAKHLQLVSIKHGLVDQIKAPIYNLAMQAQEYTSYAAEHRSQLYA